MKILLISGHGNGDSGAIGQGKQEQNETRKVVNALKLEIAKFAEVEVYDQTHDAFKDYLNGKLKKVTCDYVLEIHFNSGSSSAHGTEIYITSKEKAHTVEFEIMKQLSSYFVNRGVKVTDFSVINTYKNRGISSALLELCFITSKKDMQVYQSKFDGVIKAIANGVKNGFGLGGTVRPPQPPQTPKPKPPMKTKKFAETGTFTLNTDIYLRELPKISSKSIDLLKKGDKVKYDYVIMEVSGHVWIRQPRDNGGYGWLATGTTDSKAVRNSEMWGEFR